MSFNHSWSPGEAGEEDSHQKRRLSHPKGDWSRYIQWGEQVWDVTYSMYWELMTFVRFVIFKGYLNVKNKKPKL